MNKIFQMDGYLLITAFGGARLAMLFHEGADAPAPLLVAARRLSNKLH